MASPKNEAPKNNAPQSATPRHLQILEYTYDLPESRIARYPLPDRDASKLLIYKDGSITEGHYRDLAEYIPTGAFMIFNDTKVIEARLLMQKPTGGQIEIFCLEPLDTEPSGAMMQQGHATWKCLVGGAGKWKDGPLEKEWTGTAGSVRLSAEKAGTLPDGYKIRFSWTPADLHFAEVLHRAGLIPLPPYLNRQAERSDTERYQTVYARFDGSVAAPTAGLHFTDDLLHRLNDKGVKTGFVTLHVGAGTFKPVKAQRMEDHVMHAEWIDVPADFIAGLIKAAAAGETSSPDNAPTPGNASPPASPPAPLIPVGTTALRTLESLYWMGVKVLHGPVADMEALAITQWEIYDELPQDISRAAALAALLGWLKEKGTDRLVTQTQLLIAPGYRVRMADALVTNFHQPGSTLLLLVAALVGEDWKKVYAYALEHDFRFLSYGDGSLLWF